MNKEQIQQVLDLVSKLDIPECTPDSDTREEAIAILQRALAEVQITYPLDVEPVGHFQIDNQGGITTYEQVLDRTCRSWSDPAPSCDIDELCIPLYRHPAPRRELSDAEIMSHYKGYGSSLIEFARAVLEAAK